MFNLLAFGGIALAGYYAGELHQYWSILPIKLFVVVNLVASYAAVVLSFILFFSSWLIMQRLQNFESYEKSILEKWGSDAFVISADNDP
jgi:hypothetical protein